MDNIKLYEVDSDYITYLSAFAKHLFLNKKPEQANNRKYIGVVFEINGFEYFAPMSSFKEKHFKMKDSVDFIKVKNYAVINLNNMFPAHETQIKYVDISAEKNSNYRLLLLAEYRYIKSIQDKIRKNAQTLYGIKLKNDGSSLSERCNDFIVLEKACKEYMG